MEKQLKFSPLSPLLIEKGVIFECRIAVLGDYEVGILHLFPHSKIRNHKHCVHWEVYLDLKSKKIIDVCDIGQSHGLENDTDEILEVIFIEGNNGVAIPDEFKTL